MKNRDIYNDKLDKLKKTYENETENYFWKLKLKQQLETKINYKVKAKVKTTETTKTSWATIIERDTISTTGGNTTTDNKDN